MRVLLELNHPTRDLLGLCWLSKVLLKNKYIDQVYIVPREEFSLKLLLKYKFNIAIFGDPRSKWIYYLKGLGSSVIVHETEGLPYSMDWVFHTVSKRIQNSIDQVWTWGDKQKISMQNNKLLKKLKSKIFVTGSIRYEYYKSLKNTSQRKKYFQLNTNFPSLSPYFRSLTDDLKEYLKIKYRKVNPNFVIDLLNQSSRRERLIYFFADLIKSTKLLISLRTHPYESDEYYLSHEKFKNRNFLVRSNTDIHDDLDECFACVNTGCQTTLDCLIRDVIPISSEKYGNIWDEYSLSLADIKDLNDLYENQDYYKSLIKEKLEKSDLEHYLKNLKEDLIILDKFNELLQEQFKKKLLNRVSKTILLSLTILELTTIDFFKKILVFFGLKKKPSQSKLISNKVNLDKIIKVINSKKLKVEFIDKKFFLIK